MKSNSCIFLSIVVCLTMAKSSISAQQCHDYSCVIAKVERLMKQNQKDYKIILDNLESAEQYPDSKPEQIRVLRRSAFNAIEEERKAAIKAQQEAKKQLSIAEREKKKVKNIISAFKSSNDLAKINKKDRAEKDTVLYSDLVFFLSEHIECQKLKDSTYQIPQWMWDYYFQILSMRASALLDIGEVDKSKIILTSIIESTPNDIFVRSQRTYVNLVSGDAQACIEDAIILEQQNQSTFTSNINCGVAHCYKGEYADAELYLNKALHMKFKNGGLGNQPYIHSEVSKFTSQDEILIDSLDFANSISEFINYLNLINSDNSQGLQLKIKNLETAELGINPTLYITNWLYLILNHRDKDYSHYFMLGILWEKALFFDKSYECHKQFIAAYKKDPHPTSILNQLFTYCQDKIKELQNNYPELKE